MLRFRTLLLAIGLVIACYTPSYGQIVIPMEKKGGVFLIKGEANGVPMTFVFDTGASDVCISLTEALFMLKNGYLKQSDLKGVSYAQLANGDIDVSHSVLLKELRIGKEIVLFNIEASISNNLSAPLLLGQSALSQLGAYTIKGNTLIVEKDKNFNGLQVVDENYYKEEGESIQLLNQAKQMSEMREYDRALESLNSALKKVKSKGTRAEIYEEMAYIYWSTSQLENAVRCAKESIYEEATPYGYYNLGGASFDLGNFKESESAFKAFLTSFENNPRIKVEKRLLGSVYNYLGKIHEKKGEPSKAVEYYEKCYNTESDPQICYKLANLSLSQNNYTKAIKYFKEAIDFYPDNVYTIELYYKLGVAYLGERHTRENIALAQKAFDKSFRTYLDFGIVNDIGTTDETIKEKVLEFTFYSVKSMVYAARLAYEIDPHECANRYATLLDAPPIFINYVEPIDYAYAIYSYKDLGDISSANSVVEKAYERFNSNVSVDIMFAQSLLLDSNNPKRIEILSNILKCEYTQTPQTFDWGTVYNNLAWTYCCLKEYQKALPYSERSVKLNPRHDYSWETLGEIYYYLGQYEKCIEAMSKCLQISEKYPDAFKIRGLAYQALGKKKEAKEDFQREKERRN